MKEKHELIPITVEAQKKISLDILVNVAEFCDKHGLKYYLSYGTLLGAVRHKGYIPWDDDIDIQMPRADYNKLISLYNKEKTAENYELLDPYCKRALLPFAKIVDNNTVKTEPTLDYRNGYVGVDIDIFPMDGIPADEDEFDGWFNDMLKIYRSHQRCVMESKSSLKRKIMVPLFRILSGGKNRFLKKAAAMHRKYPYDECEYIGSIEFLYSYKSDKLKKEWFSGTCEMAFEGYTFKAPSGYHEILTCMYGDYMTPPEVPETHHTNKAYRINKKG